MGGSHNWEGRVEIFWNKTWGAISSANWGASEATVACRHLGLPSDGKTSFNMKHVASPLHSPTDAVAQGCCTPYGKGKDHVRMTSITCSGSETNITQCHHSLSTSPNRHDVGIACRRGWTIWSHCTPHGKKNLFQM